MFKENEHPRDNDGKFTDKMKKLEEKYTGDALGTKRELTKEEKMRSVSIDMTRDNILPKLNSEDLKKSELQKIKKYS